MVKSLPANAGDIRDAGRSLGWEDPLEEGMATHSRILAWRIPWTEEPGRGATFHRVKKNQSLLKLLRCTHMILNLTSCKIHNS